VSRWELQLGSSAVAAPVFGAGGRVVAALEVRVRHQRAEVPLVQPALLVAARSLSRELAMAQTADRIGNGRGHGSSGVHTNGHEPETEPRAARGVTLPELSQQPAGMQRIG
jgi:hypothetical protein